MRFLVGEDTMTFISGIKLTTFSLLKLTIFFMGRLQPLNIFIFRLLSESDENLINYSFAGLKFKVHACKTVEIWMINISYIWEKTYV